MLKRTINATIILSLLLAACQPTEQNKKNTAVENTETKEDSIEMESLTYIIEGEQNVITYEEVNAAQQAWCDALVEIGRLKESGGDYRAFAEKVISEQYNYDHGKVFFKPTLAFGEQTFRNDKRGAISYFVGGDPKYPNDKGFALAPYVKVRYDNAGNDNEGIQIYGSVAITMGNVWVTGKDGKELMVDKTWVFKKDKDGKLRIIVHKSALPFNPDEK